MASMQHLISKSRAATILALCNMLIRRSMVQLELEQILYIVFVHSYLYLVKNDATSDATQLFSRHSQRFTSPGGQLFKIRMQVAYQWLFLAILGPGTNY